MPAALTKFVVVGVQRSGTTLVTTSLDSHPAIHCAGELFKMRQPGGRVDVKDGGYRAYLESSLGLRLADRFLRQRLVYRFLDGFFDSRGYQAIGFKLMKDQTYPRQFPMVVPYLIDRQVSVIHIKRANVFKIYLSRLSAQRRRVFHATHRPAENIKLTVPTRTLTSQLSRIVMQQERLREWFSTRVPYLTCTYEDYIADPANEGQKLLSFLGVPDATLNSPLVKLGSDDLTNVVDNIDQVQRSVRGTPYENCLG